MNRRNFLRGFVATALTVAAAQVPAVGLLTQSGPKFFGIGGGTGGDFDFYISTTGSDSNPGTLASPWAITALNTKRATYSGKVVGLLDGTYNIRAALLAAGPTAGDFDSLTYDVAGGTNGAPTILRAVNLLQAHVTARSGSNYGNTTAANAMLGHTGQVHRGYVEFDGIKFSGSNRWAIRIGIKNGAQAKFLGVRILNCEFTDFNGTALFGTGVNVEPLELNSCSGHYIGNCYWHDSVGLAVGEADHFAAFVQWDSDSGVIEYNTSKSLGGGFFAKADGQWGNTLRYNYLDQTGLSGSSAIEDFNGYNGSSSTTTDIHHNILIAETPRWGTDVSSNAPASADNVKFWNNTCIILEGGASYGAMLKVGAGLLRYYNNVFVDQSSGDHGFEIINVEADGLIDRNVYYTAGSPSWSTWNSASSTSRTGYSTLATYRTGIGAEANSVTGNPLFVASGADALFYQLQSGSSAQNLGLVNGDSGGTCDAGAWGNSPPGRIGSNILA